MIDALKRLVMGVLLMVMIAILITTFVFATIKLFTPILYPQAQQAIMACVDVSQNWAACVEWANMRQSRDPQAFAECGQSPDIYNCVNQIKWTGEPNVP